MEKGCPKGSSVLPYIDTFDPVIILGNKITFFSEGMPIEENRSRKISNNIACLLIKSKLLVNLLIRMSRYLSDKFPN